jgi:hypothetical protein
MLLRSTGSAHITYSAAFNGVTGTPTYQLYLILKRIQ